MSTRCSIKYAEDEFHLYSDVIVDMLAPEGTEPPVYLELSGVEFEAYSHGRVVLTIPAATARKLGLIPAPGKSSNEVASND